MSNELNIYDATVVRVFGKDDQGATVKTSKYMDSGKFKGETLDTYYTLWSKGREPFEFDQGDVVSHISGEVSANHNKYQNKDGEEACNAQLVVNNAVVAGGVSEYEDEDEDEGDAF